MAKGYWVSVYRVVHDQAKLDAYAPLAKQALDAHGGRPLIRGVADTVYENGVKGRTVVIEFDSVAQAKAARDSGEYRKALDALADGVDRDFRIVEGVG